MLDHEPTGSGSGLEPTADSTSTAPASGAPRRRRTASRPAGSPSAEAAASDSATAAPPVEPAAAEEGESPQTPAAAGAKRARAPRKAAAKSTTARKRTRATPDADAPAQAPVAEDVPVAVEEVPPPTVAPQAPAPAPAVEEDPAAEVAVPKARRARKRAVAPVAAAAVTTPAVVTPAEVPAEEELDPQAVDESAHEPEPVPVPAARPVTAPVVRPGALIFQAPVVVEPVRRVRATAPQGQPHATPAVEPEPEPQPLAPAPAVAEAPNGGDQPEGKRRRRRNRNTQGGEPASRPEAESEPVRDAEPAARPFDSADDQDDQDSDSDGSSRRRRRRRRRQTVEESVVGAADVDDPPNTVVKIREPRERRTGRSSEPDSVRTGDDVLGVRGSVRLAAKQQRRRDGRSTRSRRAPIVSEAEFLARRESVERVMVVRQTANRTQIGVLEDGVLVEHYVNRESSVSYVGNVYLGKVQNVLPSMEAAFVDINKGRNAVLYAGEVNFSAAGLEGQPKRIESALKSGQPVLVQVTKDPIGHKGARLTSQISLPGRFLVYIPGGSMMGISRKLPDNERTRLKQILKKVVPEDGGVIVRTAAEGASEEELAKDVERLVAQWEEIERRSRTANAPALLYGEPDLTVRVIRDIFNEDFTKLIVSGDEGYKTVNEYLTGVAPELAERLEPWTSETDAFSVYRVDEQLAKALDRKVWLPSGGSLVIDRTEAMVVIDVNTGKFTGQGSNSLEETVTRNNLEAAEEIVRQLRLRDLGGIIVIDFIDMVLESNRELVLRRLLECLGRDRTKHQVAEVTSLGLVQMTRKRVGQGLLEAFSETCDHCNGRGVVVHFEPVEPHGRKPVERSVKPQLETVADEAEETPGAQAPEYPAHHGPGGAAESRASRRRRRKGKHHDAEDGAFYSGEHSGATEDADEDVEAVEAVVPPGTALREVHVQTAVPEPAEPSAPLNLKAHAEDPDAAVVEEAAAESDTGRPRRRRRAASRPAGSPSPAEVP